MRAVSIALQNSLVLQRSWDQKIKRYMQYRNKFILAETDSTTKDTGYIGMHANYKI